MAQWARAHSLASVRALYASGPLSLDLRHFFAEWIEAQPWAEINTDNADHLSRACELVSLFGAILAEKIKELASDPSGDALLLRFRLEDIAGSFQHSVIPDPAAFVRIVQQCLAQERVELALAAGAIPVRLKSPD